MEYDDIRCCQCDSKNIVDFNNQLCESCVNMLKANIDDDLIVCEYCGGDIQKDDYYESEENHFIICPECAEYEYEIKRFGYIEHD